jgi:hypothetical protein
LPLLLAIARSGPREAEFWERAIGRREQTEADFRRARELIIGSGALDATLDLAADYADKAKAALAMFPANDWRTALEEPGRLRGQPEGLMARRPSLLHTVAPGRFRICRPSATSPEPSGDPNVRARPARRRAR